LVRLKGEGQERRLAELAWQCGLSIQALSDWCIADPAGSGLLLGFANFTQQAETERAVARLAGLIKGTN